MNERDPELEALWRAQSTQTPPSSVDDAILAAARRAVHARPIAAERARAPWPAWATLAAAASIGVIAIGVWQLQPKDADVMTATVTDVPARVSAPLASKPLPSKPLANPAAPVSPAPASPDTAAAAERKDEAATPSGGAQRTVPTQRSEAVAPSMNAQRAPAQRSGAMVAPPPSANAPTAREPTASQPTASAPAASEPAASGALSDKRAMNASERAQPEPQKDAGAGAGLRKDATDNALYAAKPASNEGGGAAMRSKATAQADAMPRAPVAPSPLPRASSAPTPVPGASPAPSPVPGETDNARTVAAYVDAIRHALDARQIDLAVAQLTAMRAQYPDADAKLPIELRVWAATVPRDNP